MTTYSGIDIETTLSVKGPDGRSIYDLPVTVTVLDYGSDGWEIHVIYVGDAPERRVYDRHDPLFPILAACVNCSHIESMLQSLFDLEDM